MTKKVHEKYLRGDKLGEGTFAVVYAGTEIGSDRKIAIKKIKGGLFKDGIDLSALREIKCLQELRHPNIIELIDVFSMKKNINLVLEFLYADLEMIIKNKNVLFSSADIKSWMLMTFKGIFYCHESFILHRDLKPNNLLLASNGLLKLADFGLSRDYGDPSKVLTSCVVTIWYRAPELLHGAKLYGCGIDIWAIGCIFAELMLRTPYLAGDSDANQLKIMYKALGTPTESDWPGMKSLPNYSAYAENYPRPPLKSLFTAASTDAIDLLEKMLIFDPIRRITAKEALSHFYFRNHPRPTKCEKLPKAELSDNGNAAIIKKMVPEPNNLASVSRKLFQTEVKSMKRNSIDTEKSPNKKQKK